MEINKYQIKKQEIYKENKENKEIWNKENGMFNVEIKKLAIADCYLNFEIDYLRAYNIYIYIYICIEYVILRICISALT